MNPNKEKRQIKIKTIQIKTNHVQEDQNNLKGQKIQLKFHLDCPLKKLIYHISRIQLYIEILNKCVHY